MRYLFLSILIIALFAVVAEAGQRCRNGKCEPTAAKTCAPDCKCQSGGECTCGANCPHKHARHAHAGDCDRGRFMQRGPVRRAATAPFRLFGRVFGCRGC